MLDWNVVVTVQGQHYQAAKQDLHNFGPVARTDYYNVLVLHVPDIEAFLDGLNTFAGIHPNLHGSLARVVPVTERFRFQSPEEFETRLRTAVEPWLGELAGRRFHVRMHRRGFKGQLSSQSEEQFLDHHIIAGTTAAGAPAQVDFADPDYILAVETVGQQAGVSLWSREARACNPFLKLD